MNKKQRNEIYREAYELIETDQKQFICHALGNCKEFDEFWLSMPEQFNGHESLNGSRSTLWFTEEELDIYYDNFNEPIKNLRLTILALCIAMTD